jgi:hypothetical protein
MNRHLGPLACFPGGLSRVCRTIRPAQSNRATVPYQSARRPDRLAVETRGTSRCRNSSKIGSSEWRTSRIPL